MAYKFNPFTGTLDYYETGGGSGIATDGTSITSAVIPFEFGISIPSTDSSGAAIILDQDDLFTRTLSFELATNRVTLTNPEVGGRTKIHGYNRIELTTNSKSWTLLDAGSSIVTFDMDFAGSTNIFDNAVTFGAGPLTANFMTASRPVVTDASKNLVSGSVSAPILFSAGAFGLDYNTTNLQLTASKLNTIQDIATSSSPTFSGLTLGVGGVGVDYQLNFDGESNDAYFKWLEDEAILILNTRGASDYWYVKGDPAEYTAAYVVNDQESVNGVGRSAFQSWIRQVTNSGAGSELTGYWGGVYDEGASCQNLGTATGMYAYNVFTGTNSRTINVSQGIVSGTEVGSNCTIPIIRGVVAQAVASWSGTSTTTNEALRVKETLAAPTNNYGAFFEKLSAGSSINAEVFFQTSGGVYFRAVGQKITSTAASTLDIDTTTTGNLRVGGTTEYSWTATTFTFADANNIAVGTSTGTKIGTATTQKLSLWNATPIVQPTTAIAAATFVANTSGIVNDTATFDGYTLGQVVKALRNFGVLA